MRPRSEPLVQDITPRLRAWPLAAYHTPMRTPDVIMSQMQRLGFSQYEAKAYLGLLRHSPATGYELSKRCEVPRSMIYETLGKLVTRGAAYIVPSQPTTYAPVPAADLVNRLRADLSSTFDELEHSLAKVERTPEVEVVHHLRGDAALVREMRSLVDRAERELWLSLWSDQVPLLRADVRRAEERGVKVFSVLFGATEAKLGRTFFHGYMEPEVVKVRLGGHLSIAARDSAEAVIAEFVLAGESWAVKSHDPALVLIATDYIRHDIMFDVLMPEIGVGRLEQIWRNDPDLVHVLTGAPQP